MIFPLHNNSVMPAGEFRGAKTLRSSLITATSPLPLQIEASYLFAVRQEELSKITLTESCSMNWFWCVAPNFPVLVNSEQKQTNYFQFKDLFSIVLEQHIHG